MKSKHLLLISIITVLVLAGNFIYLFRKSPVDVVVNAAAFQKDTVLDIYHEINKPLKSDTVYNFNGHRFRIVWNVSQIAGQYIYQETDSSVLGYFNNFYSFTVFKDGKLLWKKAFDKQGLIKNTFYSQDSSDNLPYAVPLILPDFETMCWDENIVFTFAMIYPDSDFGEEMYLIFNKEGKIIHSGVGMGYGGGEIDGGYYAFQNHLFLPNGILDDKGERNNFQHYPDILVGANRKINDSLIFYFLFPETEAERARIINMRTLALLDTFHSEYLLLELGFTLQMNEMTRGKWLAISPYRNDSVMQIDSESPLSRSYTHFNALEKCPGKSLTKTFQHRSHQYEIAWDTEKNCPCIKDSVRVSID